jgi:hypothetical protein
MWTRILSYFTCSVIILVLVHSVKQQFDKMGVYLPVYKKKEKDKKQYRELLEIIKHVNLEPKPNTDTEKYVVITDLGMKNIVEKDVDNDLDEFINAL